MGGVEEKLHHEVFPVNVNATPEIGEACGEVIQMVGLGKIKTKHEQQTYNQVERSRDTQVKQVHPNMHPAASSADESL